MPESEDFTVASARQAAADDDLAAWVAGFLASPGSDNAALAQQLADQVRVWSGPMKLPFDQLHRLAGPEGEPVLCPVDDDEWGDNVDDMAENIEDGWEPPPLIVTWRDGQLVLEDGNHRVESLRRAGAEDGWAVVGFADADERERFESSDVASRR